MGQNSINHVIILSIVITLVMLSGCTENNDVQSVIDDNVSKPDNGQFIYRDAVVENIDIMILESFPVQVMVNARGYLPDGCTGIDSVTTSKAGNTF
ncbi:MAG: hypothetical protein M8352_10825, partial [ANME-2 cluster archaeon]|nr:hypothetical protein [ANME-2 cluster archaeon]